jgi:hypothetical protein
MTEAHREILQRLHLEYQIAFDKAMELVSGSFEETVRQLDAFGFREIKPKNKAGFLIEAIEQKYSLPDGYYAHQREAEAAAERNRRQSEIDACPLCDERGWRNIRSEQDNFYGMMHQCTHDPEIESQFEDHNL